MISLLLNVTVWYEHLNDFPRKNPTSFFYLIRLGLNLFAFSAFQDLFISKPFAAVKKMLAYMGESIQEWTKQNLWKAAFKSFGGVWSALGRPYPLKFFKDCLPQIWLGSFLNTLYRNTVKHFNFHSFINPSQSMFFLIERLFEKIYRWFWKSFHTMWAHNLKEDVDLHGFLYIYMRILDLCWQSFPRIYHNNPNET